jgi:predicted transcriptional regulator
LVLSAAQEAVTTEEIAEASDLPLFRARSAVRGLVKEGLLEKEGESYLASARGREKLIKQQA